MFATFLIAESRPFFFLVADATAFFLHLLAEETTRHVLPIVFSLFLSSSSSSSFLFLIAGIRFYQHSHASCFCCNAGKCCPSTNNIFVYTCVKSYTYLNLFFLHLDTYLFCSESPPSPPRTVALDEISVQTGGWPVRVIADQRFELYADGKKIGDGEWAKRENSIDVNRFRIPTTSEVIGIWIEGVPKARAGRTEDLSSAMSGVLASIADSLVTSSSWSCTSVSVGGEKWREDASKRAVKDWLTWPMAAELGTNDPGTEPWGQIPGIALSSRWIYSHSTVQNKKTTAYCR